MLQSTEMPAVSWPNLPQKLVDFVNAKYGLAINLELAKAPRLTAPPRCSIAAGRRPVRACVLGHVRKAGLPHHPGVNIA